MQIQSTRSNQNEDARRDFDGFDRDEELRRFREAVRLKQWEAAAELAGNLDEHMSRGGSLPEEWRGPKCMRTLGDFKVRIGMEPDEPSPGEPVRHLRAP